MSGVRVSRRPRPQLDDLNSWLGRRIVPFKAGGLRAREREVVRDGLSREGGEARPTASPAPLQPIQTAAGTRSSATALGSAPMPVCERTSISGYIACARLSPPRASPTYVPTIANRNPSGMLTMPGFARAKAGCAAGTVPKPGPTITRRIDTNVPPIRPETAPTVLNRFQNNVKRMTGRLPLEATAKATATSTAALAV